MAIINLTGVSQSSNSYFRNSIFAAFHFAIRPYFLEITCKEATKGQALKFLSEKKAFQQKKLSPSVTATMI